MVQQMLKVLIAALIFCGTGAAPVDGHHHAFEQASTGTFVAALDHNQEDAAPSGHSVPEPESHFHLHQMATVMPQLFVIAGKVAEGAGAVKYFRTYRYSDPHLSEITRPPRSV